MTNDDAYDNSGHIPGAEAYPPRWAAEAEAFRLALGARALVNFSYGDNTRQVFDLEVDKQRSAVDRLEGRAASMPHNQVVTSRLVRERERLDSMLSARPAHLDEAKPKRSKRRKVKATRVQEEASP